MEELISIIVPIYKVEKYLNKCLDSILAQTYKNIEVILIDDGSPDSCGNIADEYAKNNSNVKVIHKKNGGLSDARNIGIEAANGKYISLIDSDDYINSNMIMLLYNSLVESNSDISICKFKRVKEDEIIDVNINLENIEKKTFSNIEALNAIYKRGTSVYVVAWNKLYKKSLFDDIKYPVGKLHEDEFIMHHLFYKAKKIIRIEAELYYYLQREDSIMGNGFNIKRLDALEALIDRYNFFKEIGEEPLIENALFSVCSVNRNLFLTIKECENKNEYKKELRVLNKSFKTYYKKFFNESKYPLKKKLDLFYMKYFTKSYKRNLYNQYNRKV